MTYMPLVPIFSFVRFTQNPYKSHFQPSKIPSCTIAHLGHSHLLFKIYSHNVYNFARIYWKALHAIASTQSIPRQHIWRYTKFGLHSIRSAIVKNSWLIHFHYFAVHDSNGAAGRCHRPGSRAYQLYKFSLRSHCVLWIRQIGCVWASFSMWICVWHRFFICDNFSGLKPYFLFTLEQRPKLRIHKNSLWNKWWKVENKANNNHKMDEQFKAFIGTRSTYSCALVFIFYLFNLKLYIYKYLYKCTLIIAYCFGFKY